MAKRRFARGIAAVGVVFAAALAWVFEPVLRHPHVDPLPPVIEKRTPSDASAVTIVVGGDFAPTDAAMGVIQAFGWRWPYQGTDAILRGADIAFANLESPVTRSERSTWVPKRYLYRTDPAASEAWKWLGLDIVSLANNHVLDYRARGLSDTLTELDRTGIAHVGAGEDEASARRAVVFDVGGTRIGFLAYLESRPAYGVLERLFARKHRPGCAELRVAELEDDVRRLRQSVDWLVVSVHWGDNYAGVSDAQRAYARILADLGVDVVVGHHSHSAQPAVVIGRTTVLYSLGNYAWGAPGHGLGELSVGLLARVRVTPRPARIAEVSLLPIVTQNRLVHFQPRRLRQDERAWLDAVVDASRSMGTRIVVDADEDGPFARITSGG